MKMYVTSMTRGMAFTALLMTLTATAAIAQATLLAPGGGQAIRICPAK